MRLGRLLPVVVVLTLLAFPAAAAADDFQKIFGDYKADGQLDGCYGPDQIHNAGQSIPPDIEQYAPGFGDALSSAQSQCGGTSPAPAAPDEPEKPALVSAGTPDRSDGIKKKKAVREPPAPKLPEPAVSTDLAAPELVPAGAAVNSETPGALIDLLVAAGIAVVLALAWTIAWFMGWSPERLTKPVVAAFESVWDRVAPGR